MKTAAILTAIILALSMASAAQAAVVTQAVGYTDGGVALEGYVAYDDATAEKRPGILVVHEWWGLNDYVRQRARQLAALGYIAFALDMYGKGKVTEHPKEAGEWMNAVNGNIDGWRKRALAGLEVLKQQPRTDTSRIAAIGYCFGGATVQQLVYAGADLKGVVSFHGSLVPAPMNFTPGPSSPAVLICHGAADAMVKPDALTAYVTSMEASGLDWQMISYGGAKHSFTNPGADRAGMAALAYSPSADQRSWGHMQMFFKEIF